MKRYIKIKLDTYQSLFEGKKQAMIMLQKVFYDKEFAKWIAGQMEDFDPTRPKNKYVEAFSKVFIHEYKGTYGDPHPDEKGNKVSAKIGEIVKAMRILFERENLINKIESIEERHLKIDVSRIKTFYELNKTINSTHRQLTKSLKKKGIKGLKRGQDYLEIKVNDEKFGIYIPLNWEASKVIASMRVGLREGKWCTAYAKDQSYWKNYMVKSNGIIVYIVAFTPQTISDNEKQAIRFANGGDVAERRNADNDGVSKVYYETEIVTYVNKNWDRLRENFPEIIHPLKDFLEFVQGIGKGKPSDFKEQIDGVVEIRNGKFAITIDEEWFGKDADAYYVEKHILPDDQEWLDMNYSEGIDSYDAITNLFDEADKSTLTEIKFLFEGIDDLDDIDDYDELKERYGWRAVEKLVQVYKSAYDDASEDAFNVALYKGFKDAIKEVGKPVSSDYNESTVYLGDYSILESAIKKEMEYDFDARFVEIGSEDIIDGDLSLGINFDYWYPDINNEYLNERISDRLEEQEDEITKMIKEYQSEE